VFEALLHRSSRDMRASLSYGDDYDEALSRLDKQHPYLQKRLLSLVADDKLGAVDSKIVLYLVRDCKIKQPRKEIDVRASDQPWLAHN
jgi:hypothetical protein